MLGAFACVDPVVWCAVVAVLDVSLDPPPPQPTASTAEHNRAINPMLDTCARAMCLPFMPGEIAAGT